MASTSSPVSSVSTSGSAASTPATNPLEKFKTSLSEILTALNIVEPDANSITTRFTNLFTTLPVGKKMELIKEVHTHADKLKVADAAIHTLENTTEFTKIKDSVHWKEMKQQMAKLQGLVLLRAVNSKDCDEVMKSLTEAVSGKLKVVNEVLEANIKQDGGGRNDITMYNKYLKYKAKYLSLKK